MNIALLNIECLSSAKAIEAILKRHSNEIKILITTDPNRGSFSYFLSQVSTHLKRSGVKFTSYLFCNFVLHRLLVQWSYSLSQFRNSQPSYTPLKQLCKKLGIQYLRVNHVNSPEVLKTLEDLNIDLLSVYYFDQILHESIIQLPKYGVVNFHAAPLPNCRGLHPVIYCATKNQKKFAVTAHEITDRKIDAGAILAQTPIFQSEEREIFQLEEAVNLAGVDLYSKVIQRYESLMKTRFPQNSGSYFSNPSRTDLAEVSQNGYELVNIRKYFRRYFVTSSNETILNQALASIPAKPAQGG